MYWVVFVKESSCQQLRFLLQQLLGRFQSDRRVTMDLASLKFQVGNDIISNTLTLPAPRSAEDQILTPHPQPQNWIFRLRPGLEWKFLLRRSWLGQKLLPLGVENDHDLLLVILSSHVVLRHDF